MIKVEYEFNKESNIIALAFECNNDEDLEALDAIRVAFTSDFPKRGAYINSSKLVLQVKVDEQTTSTDTSS